MVSLGPNMFLASAVNFITRAQQLLPPMASLGPIAFLGGAADAQGWAD
jgi:hypothetical protein